MITAIHQPHYFPWLGYFDKMAKADQFILMDTVQLEKGSYMYRNRVMNQRGDVRYLTIPADKHGFLDKEYRDIQTKDNPVWRKTHAEWIRQCYGACEHFGEVWEQIGEYFAQDFSTLCDAAVQSIVVLRRIFKIDTPLIMQSNIALPRDHKKEDLVLALCKAAQTDLYLSGNGARKYMNVETFQRNGIEVQYQTFDHPSYRQFDIEPFVPGLSSLDFLFHCGIKKAGEIFRHTEIPA